MMIRKSDIDAVFTYDGTTDTYTVTSTLGETVLSGIEKVRLKDLTTVDIETLVEQPLPPQDPIGPEVTPPTAPPETQIFVVAGQSNAGRVWTANSLEDVIEQNNLDAKVVHSLRGATSIAPKDNQLDWYPFDDGREDTGELTRTLLSDIDAIMAENPGATLAGILWVQGESDVSYANQYQANLTGLHSLLVERYGTEFNFTVSQLSENMEWYTATSGQLALSQAQADFVAATPGTSLLDPDDAIARLGHTPQETVADAIHFNYDGLSITFEKPGANGTLVQETYIDTGTTDPVPLPDPTPTTDPDPNAVVDAGTGTLLAQTLNNSRLTEKPLR